MRTTFNPPKLDDLAALWTSHGGVNLGITGNAAHVAAGFSYHLGKDELHPGASSATLQRDRNGLSNAASAIDLGMLDTSFSSLRTFTMWLVARCLADPAIRHDIREIIYTADGKKVQRYSGVENEIFTTGNQGDLSHLKHTHISFFRDSEFRDKVFLFGPFFVAAWGPDVPVEIRAVDPKAVRVATAIRRFGHGFGSMINLADLGAAMTNAHQDFGAAVNPGDVQKLIALARKP
jgi:hypothetical protein